MEARSPELLRDAVVQHIDGIAARLLRHINFGTGADA
jgi:hypothetical protein